VNQFQNRFAKQLWSKFVMDKEVVEDGAIQQLREDQGGSDLQFSESLLKQRRISFPVYWEETVTMEKDEEDLEEDQQENIKEDLNQDHNPDNRENNPPHADLFQNKCVQHK
jgi:hypothetical protein